MPDFLLSPVTPIVNGAALASGNALPVEGYIPRPTGQLVRAADATGAYAAGDAIAQSTTGSTNTPIEFTLTAANGGAGILTGATCVVTAGSGTIVIANFVFNLWLFRPATDIPFAAGSYPADNAAMNISAAAMKQCVAVFPFTATGWLNQAGANAAAGDHVIQSTVMTYRNVAPMSLTGLESMKLYGVIQSQSTWTPGNVAQTFDFTLDFVGA